MADLFRASNASPDAPVVLDRNLRFVTRVGLRAIDPFSKPRPLFNIFIRALIATALFRCWHIILFFTAWATCITLICHNIRDISVQSTLLTVWGTVLGFIVSYRTSSSFQRYDDGRKHWSAITYGCRTFVRTIWFHIPDTSAADEVCKPDMPLDEQRARVLIEKKSAVNLVEAFAVAVKHYLRGEEGIYYDDLYHLLKHLPAYALPAGRPSLAHTRTNLHSAGEDTKSPERLHPSEEGDGLPYPVTSPHLRPAHNPPRNSIFDIFPLSLIAFVLLKKGRDIKGRKAAKKHASERVVSHNIPLEITLYLSSYIAALQARRAIDVPTTNTLIAALNCLVDSLTGLERILTTPIPFSYSVHLWTVMMVYCLTLPFQVWKYLGWVTIPFTTITAFIFFGFIVAGEEIENPFGYDKNDLNMDYFTENIIRQEILAVTAYPIPKVSDWAFSPQNDLFGVGLGTRPGSGIDGMGGSEANVIPPEEWVRRGTVHMRSVLEAGMKVVNRAG